MTFKKEFLEKQKEKLIHLKIQIMSSMKENYQQEVFAQTEDVMEDGDQAQVYINQNLSFSLQESNLKRLHDIELALSRIEDGTYGVCEETGEPIALKRLEKQPWVRLSLDAQEELEREQRKFSRVA